ncbi:MAG: hypothetical protein U1E20_03845 [Methylocystis sp.]|mgnify:CR=1 FL=1|uniref:hypothetical protein n=1 Tax=Methylocystis sp. TaxID=1911079 RepID=UPI003940F5AB
MSRLLIAALALGVAGFVSSAISAPAAARAALGADGVMQTADDREQGQSLERQGDWWGRGGPSWRDPRPWSEDEWRRNPDWDEEGPGPDGD